MKTELVGTPRNQPSIPPAEQPRIHAPSTDTFFDRDTLKPKGATFDDSHPRLIEMAKTAQFFSADGNLPPPPRQSPRPIPLTSEIPQETVVMLKTPTIREAIQIPVLRETHQRIEAARAEMMRLQEDFDSVLRNTGQAGQRDIEVLATTIGVKGLSILEKISPSTEAKLRRLAARYFGARETHTTQQQALRNLQRGQ